MSNKEKRELILTIIFLIVIPFCLSIWALLNSGEFNKLRAITFSNNKILGFWLSSLMWILGIGRVSERFRQSEQGQLMIILTIIIMILLPFGLSIWCLLTSDILKDFLAIIFSNSKVLGSLLLSFLWIGGLGKLSEFLHQYRARRLE
jgi:hypothetical protein